MPSIAFPDGFALYESRAICRYLARKYGIPLLPPADDLEATARFERAAQEEMLYFAEPAGRISFEGVVKPVRGLPVDEAAVAAAVAALEPVFDVAERALRDRHYMAGDTCTLVDLDYVPFVQRFFVAGCGHLVTSRPAVKAWWERVVNRPAIAKMLAADAEARAAAAAEKK